MISLLFLLALLLFWLLSRPKPEADWWTWYRTYLQSPEWKERRLRCFIRDGFRCRYCGDSWRLMAHHVSYRNVGHEEPEDLATACRTCHRLIHNREF